MKAGITGRQHSGYPTALYLIVGTRVTHDVCHNPDLGRTLYTEVDVWRIKDANGQVIKSGRV